MSELDKNLEVDIEDIHHAILTGVDEETHQAWQEEYDTWEEVEDTDLTFSERSSDAISNFVGSWAFVLTFMGVMFAWVLINILPQFKHWDTFPFILLNLALSAIAGLQAPLIMMAQRRQDDRDRSRAKLDFELSRKAEREIKSLHTVCNQVLSQNQMLIGEIRKLKQEINNHVLLSEIDSLKQRINRPL